ncbi:MAG: sulfurtransferase TusA family protein [Syntrophobacterales bacterium]|nr:MAG: sulfurtransferase TusA family protein [Syntrophobacterales bacterium]
MVDARGLSCPQPVVLTKKAIEETGEVTVVVDNRMSRDNVHRMGESHGCEVNIEEKEDGIYIHIEKRTAADVVPSATPAAGTTVLVIRATIWVEERRNWEASLYGRFSIPLPKSQPSRIRSLSLTTG